MNTTDAGIFWASYHGERSAHSQISTESMLMYECCARGSQTLFNINTIKRINGINQCAFQLLCAALTGKCSRSYSTERSAKI